MDIWVNVEHTSDKGKTQGREYLVLCVCGGGGVKLEVNFGYMDLEEASMGQPSEVVPQAVEIVLIKSQRTYIVTN